jgi:hypothetical protein
VGLEKLVVSLVLQYRLSAVEAAATTKVKDLVAVAATASVTRMVKVELPVTVGVPEITPVEELRERPVGNVPTVTVQLPYGAVPPVAVMVVE